MEWNYTNERSPSARRPDSYPPPPPTRLRSDTLQSSTGEDTLQLEHVHVVLKWLK